MTTRPPDYGRYNNQNNERKRIDELIGICKGMQVSGDISIKEAQFLEQWLSSSQVAADIWPINVLNARVASMLEDGILDAAEKKELLDLLTKITGYTPGKEIINITTGEIVNTLTSDLSALPLDNPQPKIIFKEKKFCLTGNFIFGPRAKCQDEITKRGGSCHSGISQNIDFLVIGLISSPDWTHANFGTKIEKAVKYRLSYGNPAIVSEEHWTKSL